MTYGRTNLEDQGRRLVARDIAEDLDVLERRLHSLRNAVAVPSVSPPLTPEVAARLVKSVLTARRKREEIFGSELFADPAWDILLQMYAAHVEHRRVSVTAASATASVPATTGLRWLDKLEKEGLLVRENDPFDGRRTWIGLTDHAVSKMKDCLQFCGAIGVPL